MSYLPAMGDSEWGTDEDVLVRPPSSKPMSTKEVVAVLDTMTPKPKPFPIATVAIVVVLGMFLFGRKR